MLFRLHMRENEYLADASSLEKGVCGGGSTGRFDQETLLGSLPPLSTACHGEQVLAFVSCVVSFIVSMYHNMQLSGAFTSDQNPTCQMATVGVNQLTAADTASAVLLLSKAAWKLGISLSKLNRNDKLVNITVKDLAGDVRALSIECDSVFAELEEVVSSGSTRSRSYHDSEEGEWDHLLRQVEETGRTLQELETFVQGARGEESNPHDQAQCQRRLERVVGQITSIKKRVFMHTKNLRTTPWLINT